MTYRVEADVSECRDQVQTIRKQRDVDSKKTSFLSEAEYILALKVDEVSSAFKTY